MSLQSFGNSPPLYPNYRLGPIDGSPCDTLGIDVAAKEVMTVEAATFGIYPNPAQNLVTVTFAPLADWEHASIALWDATGTVRLTQKVETKAKETKLSIQNLPNGVYWVSLKPDGHAASVQKLVILR